MTSGSQLNPINFPVSWNLIFIIIISATILWIVSLHPPKFACWSTNPQYLTIWFFFLLLRAFKEAIKVKSGCMGGPWSHVTSIFIRREDQNTGNTCRPRGDHVRTRWLSVSQQRGLRRNQPSWHLPLKLWENKFLLLKPSGLWYFAMAALANQ